MFGLKTKQKHVVTEPKKVKSLVPEPTFTGKRQEEYEIAKSLKLSKQVEIIKLEELGYKIVRREDLCNLLSVDEGVNLGADKIEQFEGKIPLSVMRKCKDLLQTKIFDTIRIVAPRKYSPDPLLIGEKYSKNDTKWAGGERDHNFWGRDTVIALIAKWDVDEKDLKEKED